MAAIAMNAGKGNRQRLAMLAQHVQDEGAYQLLQAFLHKPKPTREEITTLIRLLKNRVNRQDETIASIDKAHKDYAMNQLGVYEEGRDALKAMAAKGMNLAGKFVEASMSEARRGGRSR